MSKLDEKIKQERKKLVKLVNEYGTQDERVIKQSQKLDKYITESMKELNKNKLKGS